MNPSFLPLYALVEEQIEQPKTRIIEFKNRLVVDPVRQSYPTFFRREPVSCGPIFPQIWWEEGAGIGVALNKTQ